MSCYDARFEQALRKLIKRSHIERADVVRFAGGAKSLASPENPSEREFVLEQIRKSIRLHGTERVLLTVHSDCGAYGGLAKFKNDTQAEVRHHREELLRAAAFVREALPEVKVECYLIDFEGIWQAGDELAEADAKV